MTFLPYTTPFEIAAAVVLAVMAISFALALLRLFRGPSMPDRVLALDLMAYLTIGFVAVGAMTLDAPGLLQPALVLAFIVFMATVALARYIEKLGPQRKDS